MSRRSFIGALRAVFAMVFVPSSFVSAQRQNGFQAEVLVDRVDSRWIVRAIGGRQDGNIYACRWIGGDTAFFHGLMVFVAAYGNPRLNRCRGEMVRQTTSRRRVARVVVEEL